MEHLTPIITAALPIFIYWANSFIKSKNISNQIDRLKSDIEFSKETNAEFRDVLIRIYEGKVFLQNFGFLPLNYRIPIYLDFYSKSNISVDAFKAFYKQGYLVDNKEENTVSLQLGKLSKIAPPLYWFGFVLLFVFFGILIYLSIKISTETDVFNTLAIVGYGITIIAAMACYYFAIKILKENIFPFYEAKRIITKNK